MLAVNYFSESLILSAHKLTRVAGAGCAAKVAVINISVPDEKPITGQIPITAQFVTYKIYVRDPDDIAGSFLLLHLLDFMCLSVIKSKKVKR